MVSCPCFEIPNLRNNQRTASLGNFAHRDASYFFVRSLVAWIAGRREIESPKPIDEAIFQDGEQVIGP